MRAPTIKYVFGLLALVFLAQPMYAAAPVRTSLIVSVPDQKLVVCENGQPVKTYKVSTSKYGLGDSHGSYRTPLGEMMVAGKYGAGAAKGTVFKGRKPTGEVVKVNAAGRDPIVTRILWLKGLESQNRNAFGRGIYIHGTPQEKFIGRPASYGCIRMRSKDVVKLFNRVPRGARVEIVNERLSSVLRKQAG